MAYDLKISQYGDLLFGGNRDLQGTSGLDLIEQRIWLRLKIARGSWVYDEDGTLGSQLFLAMRQPPAQAAAAIPMYVREALREISEIIVDDVVIEQTDLNELTLTVQYHLIRPADEDSFVLPESDALFVTVPLLSFAGGD